MNKQSRLDRLAKQLSEATERASGGAKFAKDERIWQCTADKAGNGNAVLRFLPEAPGEDSPFVQRWEHFFKGPSGKFYTYNSLESLGQEDPVKQLYRRLWDKGDAASAEEKKLRRDIKSTMRVYTNVLVLKDPGNPENEGKVFLYRFGKKILEKINRKGNPGNTGLPPVDVFAPEDGCDFYLVQSRVSDGKGGSFPNYDNSEWGPQRPLFTKNGVYDEAAFARIQKQQYKLQELMAKDQFPSYQEAMKKLEEVLGLGGNAVDDVPFDHDEDGVIPDEELGNDIPSQESFTDFSDLQRRV